MSATYLTVPAGTRAGTCRGCGAPIYWITMSTGRMHPVDCDGDAHCHVPTRDQAGRGITHFATCPQAERFKKVKR